MGWSSKRTLVLASAVVVIVSACAEGTTGTTVAPGDPGATTTTTLATTSTLGSVSTSAGEHPALGADGRIEVGETRIAYDVNTHCGVEWLLRPVNEMTWRAVDLDETDASGIDPVPTAWGQANDDIDLELTLVDETTMEATALGTDVTVTYAPDPNPPGCD